MRDPHGLEDKEYYNHPWDGLPANTCKLLLFFTEKLLPQSWVLHLNFCYIWPPPKPLTLGQAPTLLIYLSFPSLPNPAFPEQNQGRKPMSKWERWQQKRETQQAGETALSICFYGDIATEPLSFLQGRMKRKNQLLSDERGSKTGTA